MLILKLLIPIQDPFFGGNGQKLDRPALYRFHDAGSFEIEI